MRVLGGLNNEDNRSNAMCNLANSAKQNVLIKVIKTNMTKNSPFYAHKNVDFYKALRDSMAIKK